MVHQPGQNQIILETEKGTEDSVFDHLTEIYPAQTFLDPDRITIQRYAFQQPESIIISKLVTQTPMGKRVDGVPYAKLEKIMVDILVDDDRYFLFQGQELASIYENAFAHYLIDEKSMTRYARRRNAVPKLKKFLLNHPRIRFMQFSLDIK
jgi:CMP-N-acetylneuraminic acid synthetase